MEITIELSRPEAKQILGDAIRKAFFGDRQDVEVTSIEWSNYSSKVQVRMGAPEPREPAQAAA